jgi:hypothetical protein
MEKLLENVNVFKREKNQLTIYRCFKIVGVNKYFVQSADHFYLPLTDQQLRQSEYQMLELFLEENIEDRVEGYSSLEEAIIHFNTDFDLA